MTQPAKGQEPSMEEILASIRRIIADDDAAKIPPKAADPLPPPPAPVAQVPRPAPAAQVVPPPVPPPPPRAPEPVAAPAQLQIDSIMEELAAAAAAAPPAPPPTPPATPQRPETPDVLELTEAMAMTTPAPVRADGFRTIDGASDITFEETPAGPDTAAPDPLPASPSPVRDATERPLMSLSTSTAVDSAFNTLAHTVL